MKFTAVASLAFIGAVAAQNSTTAATGCVASYNTCRQPTNGVSANQAQCAANNAQCQGDCYSAYNTCRTTRTDGLSANQAACVASYASCLGENPVAATGGLIQSFIPYSATASVSGSSTSSASTPAQTAACQSSYDSCRVAPNANMAFCASQFAGCLGTNPFANNGTNTVTGAYTTQVVTAITTVCPAPTAGPYTTTIGKNVFTVSSATTVTVTDCPCTITKPVGSTMAPSGSASATTSKPAVYTGAAAQFGAGMGLIGAAAGAVMLL